MMKSFKRNKLKSLKKNESLLNALDLYFLFVAVCAPDKTKQLNASRSCSFPFPNRSIQIIFTTPKLRTKEKKNKQNRNLSRAEFEARNIVKNRKSDKFSSTQN